MEREIYLKLLDADKMGYKESKSKLDLFSGPSLTYSALFA